MKLKQIFLLLTVTLLLIGIVSATEITDNNTVKDNPNKLITPKEVEKSNINTHIPNKHINKKNIINKTTKTATKTYDINNYNDLHTALTDKNYKNVKINIKSDITLTGNTKLNNVIKTLDINGNNKNINGNNKYKFLYVNTDSTITINNIIIKNCKSNWFGGAIDAENHAILNIVNSNFINNTAKYYGGAIYTEDLLTTDNCTFYNNSVGIIDYDSSTNAYHGGAISSRNLRSINCSFINNQCENSGGAIDSSYTYIESCYFKDNVASFGGAVFCANLWDEYNIIINSDFINNTADRFGGAIDGCYNLNISRCNFINNSAGDMGGAISYLNEPDHLNIYNNIFLNNHLTNKSPRNITKIKRNGDYIFNYDEINIHDTIFIVSLRNKLQEKIYNNIFNSNLPKTKISLTLTKINEESIKATGKLTADNGKNMNDKTIKISVYGKNINVKTDKDGYYSYIQKLTKLPVYEDFNVHYMNVLYDGEGKYNPSMAIDSFEVKLIKTNIDIIKVTQKSDKSDMTVTGRFTSNTGKLLINTKLNIIVNGEKVIVKTDKHGLFKHTFTPKNDTLNKITVSFNGNYKYPYAKSKVIKVFNQTTKLTLKKVVNKDNVTFTGTFYSVSGKKLINSKLKIKVNGSVKTIKTNSKGIYSYTMKNPGKKLKVQVYYNQKSKYHYAPTSITKIL